MTVYLDSELAERARRLAPRRRLNRMVNDALAEKIADLERVELERTMREGYEAVDLERAEIDSEWQATEVEQWPT